MNGVGTLWFALLDSGVGLCWSRVLFWAAGVLAGAAAMLFVSRFLEAVCLFLCGAGCVVCCCCVQQELRSFLCSICVATASVGRCF